VLNYEKDDLNHIDALVCPKADFRAIPRHPGPELWAVLPARLPISAKIVARTAKRCLSFAVDRRNWRSS